MEKGPYFIRLTYLAHIASFNKLLILKLESHFGRLIYSSKLATIIPHDTRSYPLMEVVHEDIHWFCQFLPLYNGFCLIMHRYSQRLVLSEVGGFVASLAFTRWHGFPLCLNEV